MAVYKVGGFIFDNEETAKKAAKELKATQYILDQLKDADDAAVLSIYKRLLSQNIFETDLGLAFLKQLEDNLVASGLLEAKMSPISHGESEVQVEKTALFEPSSKEVDLKKNNKISSSKTNKIKSKKKLKGQLTIEERYKRLCIINKILIVICIGLVISIAAMFYINSTINSPTILNYEEQILNKYSNWEQELNKREEALRQKEIEQQNN